MVKFGSTEGGKDDVIWIGDDKISVDCSTANVFVRLMFPNMYRYKMITLRSARRSPKTTQYIGGITYWWENLGSLQAVKMMSFGLVVTNFP